MDYRTTVQAVTSRCRWHTKISGLFIMKKYEYEKNFSGNPPNQHSTSSNPQLFCYLFLGQICITKIFKENVIFVCLHFHQFPGYGNSVQGNIQGQNIDWFFRYQKSLVRYIIPYYHESSHNRTTLIFEFYYQNASSVKKVHRPFLSCYVQSATNLISG